MDNQITGQQQVEGVQGGVAAGAVERLRRDAGGVIGVAGAAAVAGALEGARQGGAATGAAAGAIAGALETIRQAAGADANVVGGVVGAGVADVLRQARDRNIQTQTDAIRRAIEGDGIQRNRIEQPERRSHPDDLPTGDTILHLRDGRQMLIMPNDQGTLTIYPDGNYSLNARGVQRVQSRDGVTTVTFDGGDTLSFDREGVLSIGRGNAAVQFGRLRPFPRRSEGGRQPLEPNRPPAIPPNSMPERNNQ